MESSDDEDDVPLAALLRRNAPRKRNAGASTRSVAKRRSKRALQLCDVGERHAIEFLAVVPDRVRVEAVCRRWRAMSREMPVTELDFGPVPATPTLRRDVVAMVQRAQTQLKRLVLPDISLVDDIVELITQQSELRLLRAHRMQKKHIFNILRRCAKMDTLELLDCRALTLSGWPRDAAPLREVYLNGCNFITNQAAASLVRVSGATLEKLTFTEATSLDSLFFRDLARYSERLEELTISHCSSIRVEDVRILAEVLGGSLRLLDLSSCRGISSFPDSVLLPQLQVLLLDKTKINDDGLRAISQVASSLKYLSLQDCRAISDEGISAIALPQATSGCSNLELIDLKGTAVTDSSLKVLERECKKLRLLRVDSCRSVSRTMRHKYHERERRFLSGKTLSALDLRYAERKKIEMIDLNKSDSESGESDSESDAVGDVIIVVRRAGRRRRR